MLNASRREKPRNQPVTLIPAKPEISLPDWLQFSGINLMRDVHAPDFSDQEAEVSEFSGGEGISYLDDED